MIPVETDRLAPSKVLALGLLVVALVAVSLMLAARPAHADTFTVTNTNDDGIGSLRRAMEVANKTISPTSALPDITGPVTIAGYSQPGSRPNSRKTGANDAVILVELTGFNAGSFFVDGLTIEASNVVVRELAINRFSGHGINVFFGTTGARIEGNYIGTDPSATLDRGNSLNGVTVNDGGRTP